MESKTAALSFQNISDEQLFPSRSDDCRALFDWERNLDFDRIASVSEGFHEIQNFQEVHPSLSKYFSPS